MYEERIAELLGHSARDPEVERMLDDFGISRRPVLETDEDGEIRGTQDWLLNAALGIEFGFEDRATFTDDHPDEIGEHPMLLTQIYLYGEHEGVQPYRGRLPMGLALEDGRASSRRKLVVFETTRRSYIRDTWELPNFQLTASYAKGGARLGFLLCALRRPRLPADREDAEQLPDARRIFAQLGRPLTDPDLRLALAPLKIPGSLVDQQGALIGTYRFRFGLDIRFALQGGGREVVLTEIDFYAEHHGAAVGWPGALPFGLSFSDSPDRMFERMQRQPDHHKDEDFHGTAAWRFPNFRILVDYDSMENRLTRVRVVAGSGG